MAREVSLAQLFACWVILHAFLSSAGFFQNQLFCKILSGIPSVSNSLDPDQAGFPLKEKNMWKFEKLSNSRNFCFS